MKSLQRRQQHLQSSRGRRSPVSSAREETHAAVSLARLGPPGPPAPSTLHGTTPAGPLSSRRRAQTKASRMKVIATHGPSPPALPRVGNAGEKMSSNTVRNAALSWENGASDRIPRPTLSQPSVSGMARKAGGLVEGEGRRAGDRHPRGFGAMAWLLHQRPNDGQGRTRGSFYLIYPYLRMV